MLYTIGFGGGATVPGLQPGWKVMQSNWRPRSSPGARRISTSLRADVANWPSYVLSYSSTNLKQDNCGETSKCEAQRQYASEREKDIGNPDRSVRGVIMYTGKGSISAMATTATILSQAGGRRCRHNRLVRSDARIPQRIEVVTVDVGVIDKQGCLCAVRIR